ncbi:MAG: Chaperone protein DnaJ [Fimbriimonadaceae bacterium]|nr:Chaperone protein DnaJ [Fimbriimonadaceae bacterium]
MSRSHYEILGVSRGVTDAELKAAYRKLVLKYHPDQSKEPGAAEVFISITEAYQVLSDPERRASYNRLLDGRAGETGKAVPNPKPTPKKAPAPEYRSAPRRAAAAPAPTGDVLHLTGLIGKGRVTEAEVLAQQLIRKSPTQPLPYAVLGDIARSRGDYREAAKQYALAAQMDPLNDLYQKLHESMLERVSNPRVTSAGKTETRVPVAPMVVGLVTSISAFVYASVAGDPAMTTLAPIDTWKLSTFLALIVAGLALGVTLTIAGLLDRFDAIQRGTVMRLTPSIALAGVCLFNFWLALAVFLWIGVAQNTFHPATSRMVAGAAGLTLTFVMIAQLAGSPIGLQVLLWGGNWIYLFGLMGWLVTDSLTVRR